MLTYAESLQIIGGLSSPSKMPWYGWSISAKHCITGKKLHEVPGSTCATCYALKGRYMFPNVMQAHERRLSGLAHPQFVDAFVTVLTKLFKPKEKRFRWFDSGDLQSTEHLDKIAEIARRTPFIDHWLPTREYTIVHDWLANNAVPDNLVIRMSAPLVGVAPKGRLRDLPFSTVDVEQPGIHQCPAPQQGNKCLECRACWDRDKDINYHAH